MKNIGNEDLIEFRKKHNKLTDVGVLLEKYEEDEDFKKIIEQIRNRIQEMDYDKEYIGRDASGELVEVKDITTLLLFEYIMAIEVLTQGADNSYTHEEVLAQLTGIMGKFRLSNLDNEKDKDITIYRKTRNNEIEPPKYVVDIQSGKVKGRLAGAQVFTYYEKDATDELGELKTATALFETLQREPNLDRIRQVVFHEWNHNMEITKKDREETVYISAFGRLNQEEMAEYENIRSDGNAFIFNGKKYLNYEVMDNGQGIFYSGLVTREKVEPTEENPTGVLMHNQITEGVVEKISRKILKTLGIEEIDFGKYASHVRVIDRIANAVGEEEFITQFLRDSSVLIKEFESINMGNKDGLHYIADYIDDVYMGKAPITSTLRPFGQLAASANLSPEKIDEIQSLSYWASSKPSVEMRNQIIGTFLENTKEEARDELRDEAEKDLTRYEEALEQETKFVERFTDILKAKDNISRDNSKIKLDK